MSKSIDFFEELEKTEKKMFKALQTRDLEGVKTFYCKPENAWITPDACLKRQQRELKNGTNPRLPYVFEFKCSTCETGKLVRKIKKVSIGSLKKKKVIKKENTCIKCGETKDYETEFPKSQGKPYGNICKRCKLGLNDEARIYKTKSRKGASNGIR